MMIKTYQGTIRTNKKGLGFFRNPEINDSVEISNENLKMAFDLDTVKIKIIGKNKYGNLEGEIIEIIKRYKDVWVGTIKEIFEENENRKILQFIPNDHRFYPKTKIENLKDFPKLNSDQKVLVKLTKFDNNLAPAHIKIEQILGKIGDNETEIKAAVYDRGLVIGFSKKIEDAAKKIKEESKKLITDDLPNRRDLRNLKVFTIDPFDAKDFDDAISIEYLENEKYRVGIHIADPTFFIKPGSILDQEAQDRATSIYLVDRVIPMLPEILSNDLCSLNPHEDKMSFSLIFDLDSEANILKEWFGKTIINSKKKFTYIEAQNTLDGKIPDKDNYTKDLKILTKLADKLKEKRIKNGSIQFHSVEVKFKLDNKKFPIDIYQKEHVKTMELIEEFALLSNRQISRKICQENGKRNNNPFIFRIHDKPKQEKITEIIKFLEKLGRSVDINSDGLLSAKEINKILKEAKGTPEEGILSLSILRTMQKAIYGTESRGHFGLAFKYYSHFTSPIRRYPDMIAHRLTKKYLSGENIPEKENIKIQKIANYSSEMEQKAVSAERESIAFKQSQYYSVRIGEKFFGIITGILKFGFFVENEKTKAQGLVSIRDIGDDFFVFNQKDNTIKGEKSNKIFKVGDKIETKILSVNIEDRKISLTLKWKSKK